jgi:hypothetical protein
MAITARRYCRSGSLKSAVLCILIKIRYVKVCYQTPPFLPVFTHKEFHAVFPVHHSKPNSFCRPRIARQFLPWSRYIYLAIPQFDKYRDLWVTPADNLSRARRVSLDFVLAPLKLIIAMFLVVGGCFV